MRVSALVLACFAYAGLGRRVLVASSGSQGNKPLVDLGKSHERGKSQQPPPSSGHRPAETPKASEALAAALLALATPLAAWQAAGPSYNFAGKRALLHSVEQTSHFSTRKLKCLSRLLTQRPLGLTEQATGSRTRTHGVKMARPSTAYEEKNWRMSRQGKTRVMIAGGGIGGLCAALVFKNAGYEVRVFEKTTKYRPFGGPIQIASNALESIRQIDEDVYAQILNSSTIIGDRINGLKDGISNEWFATFDLKKPAENYKKDPSVVVDRPVLQDILLSRVVDCVQTGSEVIGYEQKPGNGGIIGFLSDGSQYEADFLIGSDGIKSKVRQIFYSNPADPVWSGYTCFAAIADCVPDDIKTVGYKVFLGPRKYFVSVDVGGGRIQWYAFLNIPPRSLSVSGAEALKWLKEEQFPGWSADVMQLLDCTAPDQIEQRDLYDRIPELKWAEGNVCLLGDAAHPMMPNLGQGGGMAIEDALVLGQEMSFRERISMSTNSIAQGLKYYSERRSMRAAAVQGLSRFSSAILFQYNHPLQVKSVFPWKAENFGPRSVITRACQGFLQYVAFPLQFDFLFAFPGNAVDPSYYDRYRLEYLLLSGEMSWDEFRKDFFGRR